MLVESQRTKVLACLAITAIGFGASILFTHLLWHRVGRAFPPCPVLPYSAPIPDQFYILLYVILLAALLMCCIPPYVKHGTMVSLIAWVLFVMLDINCLQPSFYFFVLMLSLGRLWSKARITESQFFLVLRVALASLYFFGGIHKINASYYESIYLWLIDVYISNSVGSFMELLLLPLGYITPYVEILIGLGLLFPRTHKLASIAAVGMHLFILGALGPWGHNFNHIIFPWNIVLVAVNLILAFGAGSFTFDAIKSNKYVYVLIVLLWGIPILKFFHLSDRYLSHDLYSGKAYFGYILVSKEKLSSFPLEIRKHFNHYDEARDFSSLTEWSISELGVPVYPEKRVLLYYKKWFENFLDHPESVQLISYVQKEYETIE